MNKIIDKRIIDNFVAPECLQKIEILRQDEHFLLINKPSGLLSLSGKNPLNKDSVHFRLVQKFPTASMVHRLDFGTSGIMLIALSKQANANLSKQFQQRSVLKTYVSLVAGHMLDNSGQINMPIAKDPLLFPRLKTCPQEGKQALSNYKVLERLHKPESTRVQYYPQTGRTHQLRIHSQYIGHPILGCDLYGTAQSHQLASRLMLHAEKLEFDHPISGERVMGECICPF
jgi:tRNA pseudouridine32 synthase/23S rRNA pseudouridine746 synthase